MKKLSKQTTNIAIGVCSAAALVTYAAYRYLRTRAKPSRKTIERPDGEGKWDKTDEASWESFPASDAPGHY